MQKNILIVDDDHESRSKLTFLMEKVGHHVMAAANADEAQCLVRAQTPDIALIDVELPDVRGEVIATYLHELCPKVRIIFISGDVYVRSLDRFGIDVQFFPKPLDLVALLETLKNAKAAC